MIKIIIMVPPNAAYSCAAKNQTSAMAKELDVVHQEFDEREVQMAALTRALSEAGLGLR